MFVVVSEVVLDLFNHRVAVGDLFFAALDPLREIFSDIDLTHALDCGMRLLEFCLLVNQVSNLLLHRLKLQTQSNLVRGLVLNSADLVKCNTEIQVFRTLLMFGQNLHSLDNELLKLQQVSFVGGVLMVS